MKRFIIFFASFALFTDAVTVARQSSVTQHGITWTFDTDYEVGQFVNGDWWVVPNSPGGAVRVENVDPAQTTDGGGDVINGSMINPMPDPGNDVQAFDERVSQWNASLGVTYPLSLSANQSLVSAVCYEEGEERPSYMNIKYVCVLTCLAETASATDFRPAYVGTVKTLYGSAGLRRDLLPSLPSVDNAPDLASLAGARFSRPWIEFPYNWSANTVRSSYESNYGREKAVDVGGAGLLLALDENDVGDKEPLLIGMVQVGIDLYHTLRSGGGWPPNGGHLMGRKFPILFAGLMLDNADMLNIGEDYPACSYVFQEDDMAFIVTADDTGRQLNCTIGGPVLGAGDTTIDVEGSPDGLPRYTKLNGNYIKITGGPGAGQVRYIATDNSGWGTPPAVVHCTIDPPWDTVPVTDQSTYQVLGYQARHIGKAEWGGSHCLYPGVDNPSYYQSYRQLNMVAWPGEVLAARIFGLKDAWNQEAVFQVIDEYMLLDRQPGGFYEGSGCWSSGGRPPASDGPEYDVSGDFIENMWDTYRADYGCILTGLDTIAHEPTYDCSQCQYYCPQNVNDGAEITDIRMKSGVSVYPNPMDNELYIQIMGKNNSGIPVIYDRSGNIRYRFSVGAYRHTFLWKWTGTDNSGHPVEPGMYFIKIGNDVREIMVLY